MNHPHAASHGKGRRECAQLFLKFARIHFGDVVTGISID